MLKCTRVLLLTFLLAMTMAIAPALHAQDAATEDNSTRNQLIFGGAAVVILILYIKRRNRRKSGL